MKQLLILFIFFSLLGCKGEPEIPTNILNREEMAEILADIQLEEAAAVLKSPGGDSTIKFGKNHAEFICKSHNTSLAKLQKSLSYYAAYPSILDEIYAEVLDELSKKQAQLIKK